MGGQGGDQLDLEGRQCRSGMIIISLLEVIGFFGTWPCDRTTKTHFCCCRSRFRLSRSAIARITHPVISTCLSRS